MSNNTCPRPTPTVINIFKTMSRGLGCLHQGKSINAITGNALATETTEKEDRKTESENLVFLRYAHAWHDCGSSKGLPRNMT